MAGIVLLVASCSGDGGCKGCILGGGCGSVMSTVVRVYAWRSGSRSWWYSVHKRNWPAMLWRLWSQPRPAPCNSQHLSFPLIYQLFITFITFD